MGVDAVCPLVLLPTCIRCMIIEKVQVVWTVCGVALLAAGLGVRVWMQGDFEGLTRKSAESFRSFLLLPFPRIFEGKPVSTLSGTLLLKC